LRAFLFSAALAFSLPLVAVPAHADTFQYSISYSRGIASASAVFDESSIISSSGNTTVDAPFISSSYDIPLSQGPLTSVIVYPLDTSYCTGPFESCVFLYGSTPGLGLGVGLFFSAVSITSVGTYYDVNGNGTLTITDLSATPEPPSLILLLTGVVGAGASLRRRLLYGSLAGWIQS
jgi:hypothetical protein